MNATDTIIIAISAGQLMRRGEEITGGQYWQQGGRRMTASNHIIDGMPNTRTSAILSAAVEAVVWKHPNEKKTEDGKRESPRMILYPDDIPPITEEVEAFIANPSKLEENKHLAYAQIADSLGECVVPPAFCRSDSETVQGDSVFAAAAPEPLTAPK
jgi:hypothetical protein